MKKETWNLQPRKRKSSTIHKNCRKKSKKSKGRKKKKKLTSNRLSNCNCNLVTFGVERNQFQL